MTAPTQSESAIPTFSEQPDGATAVLVLSDGTAIWGRGAGAEVTTVGEVCFNTSMSGYQEILTDPSYHRQIITITYPMIGNYGIDPEVSESDRIHATGFVVKEYVPVPSNFTSKGSLADFLKEHDVPGIQGIDTRRLVLEIREAGAMRGGIFVGGGAPPAIVAQEGETPGGTPIQSFLGPQLSATGMAAFVATYSSVGGWVDDSGVLVGGAGMNDQRQPGFPRGGNVNAQRRFLHIRAFGGIVVIQPGLADADEFRMRGKGHQLVNAGQGFFGGLHWMCARGVKDRCVGLGHGADQRFILQPRADRYHTAHASFGGAGDDTIKLPIEIGEIEVAMAVGNGRRVGH